ncbi:MAG TPA: hypothetical protein DCE42_05825 [Myxococcales bacterium]|nr:hypothetical protein [Myxococcales bacterium]
MSSTKPTTASLFPALCVIEAERIRVTRLDNFTQNVRDTCGALFDFATGFLAPTSSLFLFGWKALTHAPTLIDVPTHSPTHLPSREALAHIPKEQDTPDNQQHAPSYLHDHISYSTCDITSLVQTP